MRSTAYWHIGETQARLRNVVERMRYRLNKWDVTRSNYRVSMTDYRQWTVADAAALISVPSATDDKYSRGVLGVVTGSAEYPGAAVLGVEAALRTGVGMVRYLGAASDLVLQRRPEAVTVPGRVQAWLLGSGIDSGSREPATTRLLHDALADGTPAVIDSGALDLVPHASGARVITPHHRELARVLSADAREIAGNPEFWCSLAAESLGVTVLLKGSNTLIAGAEGTRFSVGTATGWLASAGTGDVLAGILGALIATQADAAAEDPALLPRLAATAAVIHAQTAERVSAGGPLVALEVAQSVSHTVAQLLAGASE